MHFKLTARIGIKENEEADKATIQALDRPGITTTRPPYTCYYLSTRKDRNSEWQKEWENSNRKLHYIKPHIEE